MNSDITSGYEYVVAQKSEGKFKTMKIVLFIIYATYVIGIMAIILNFAVALVPLYALVPVTTWMLVFFTWKYTNPEYEYVVNSGHLVFTTVYGRRTRKEMLKLTLKDCKTIAPLNDEYRKKLDEFAPTLTFSALSSINAQDAYFATFETEDGQKAVFYFEATEKMLKICRMYNSSATVMTKVRY